MEYVLPIAVVLWILAALLLFYFSRKKANSSVAGEMAGQESVSEITDDGVGQEADPYVDLMPHVSEVENEDIHRLVYKISYSCCYS
jgi:hypothetical protein